MFVQYGDACMFAHGKADLKPFLGKKTKRIPAQGGSPGGDLSKPNPLAALPDVEGTTAYFVVKSKGFNNKP